MDVHIHMSYCTRASFRILANNYLGLIIDDHPLFDEIEKLIIDAKVTPAEVAEELMRSEDNEIVLNGVLSLLKRKIIEPPPQVDQIVVERQVQRTERSSIDRANVIGKMMNNNKRNFKKQCRWKMNKRNGRILFC